MGLSIAMLRTDSGKSAVREISMAVDARVSNSEGPIPKSTSAFYIVMFFTKLAKFTRHLTLLPTQELASLVSSEEAEEVQQDDVIELHVYQ